MSTDSTGPPRAGHSLLFRVHVVSSLVDSLVSEALSDSDLSGTEFAVTSLLARRGSETPGGLARAVGSPPATMSRTLARLEARGYVARTPHPTDGRSEHIALTDAGLAEHGRAVPPFADAMRRLRTRLGAAADHVEWGLTQLENALRGGEPSGVPAGPHSLDYAGDPLTPEEEGEVRRHIDFLRWRRTSS